MKTQNCTNFILLIHFLFLFIDFNSLKSVFVCTKCPFALGLYTYIYFSKELRFKPCQKATRGYSLMGSVIYLIEAIRLITMIADAMQLLGNTGWRAVSYTHLDVYKRQVQHTASHLLRKKTQRKENSWDDHVNEGSCNERRSKSSYFHLFLSLIHI